MEANRDFSWVVERPAKDRGIRITQIRSREGEYLYSIDDIVAGTLVIGSTRTERTMVEVQDEIHDLLEGIA